jgi:hypothetical protein
MAWRGDEEQHAGRDGPRVGEGVGIPGRYKHRGARPAAHHLRPGSRLPALPIARSPGHGLEGEQVEFAVEYVEQFLGALVQVRADVEALPDSLHVAQEIAANGPREPTRPRQRDRGYWRPWLRTGDPFCRSLANALREPDRSRGVTVGL